MVFCVGFVVFQWFCIRVNSIPVGCGFMFTMVPSCCYYGTKWILVLVMIGFLLLVYAMASDIRVLVPTVVCVGVCGGVCAGVWVCVCVCVLVPYICTVCWYPRI